MSEAWYISARFNTGMNAAKVANDALMAISIIAIHKSMDLKKKVEEGNWRERIDIAKSLMMEIAEQIARVPSDRTRTHFHEDSFHDLIDILLDRAAGNKEHLTEQMKKAVLELDRIEKCECIPSEATYSVLLEIVEAAQEVVDSSRVLDASSG